MNHDQIRHLRSLRLLLSQDKGTVANIRGNIIMLSKGSVN